MASQPAMAEATWNRIRESSPHIPSEPSTPAPQAFPEEILRNPDENVKSGRSSRRNSETATSEGNQTAPLNIDADDEDVKIAIMALGAMKNLDGKSGNDDDRGVRGKDASPRRTSSIQSASSMNSTAISSPTSTPGTELTHATMVSGGSPAKSQGVLTSASTSGSTSSTPATLADLPADFEFPAIVRDEHGNQMRVDREDMQDVDFLNRVSHLPIVRGTIRAYEIGKQRSKVVKYGGDFVESSVRAIGRPVVSRLGAKLGERGVEQLDDFACRQLDRIYPNSDARPLSREEKQSILAELDEKEQTEWKDMSEEERAKRRTAFYALRMEEREREMGVNELRQRRKASSSAIDADTRSTSASTSTATSSAITASGVRQQKPSSRRSTSEQGWSVPMVPSSSSSGNSAKVSQAANALVRTNSEAVASGSRTGWSSMLVEAGVTAGGLSAAMSEESMKSLKYCLQWLQYATAHIEHQITVLRDLIVKLNHGELDLSSPAAQNLASIKGDVVNTIRGVVDVVGKYAGGALPEPARASVKAFILSLPARWATVNRPPSVENGRQGSFGGSPASPSFSPAHLGGRSASSSSLSSNSGSDRGLGLQPSAARQQQMNMAATAQAANRVLTLAVESLDILRSVTVVFGESLDRADLWVERLRVVGLQRKRAHEQAAAEEAAARIDDGMGGALASGPNWESVRRLGSSGRGGSPSAESDVSMATTASAKRRRVKARPASSGGSHSPGPHGSTATHMSNRAHSMSDEEDEGSHTETERPAMAGRSGLTSFSSGGSGYGGASSAVASPSMHLHHHAGGNSNGGGLVSSRRKAGNRGMSSRGHHPARTPSASNTPIMQELSLSDNPLPPTAGKHRGTMDLDRTRS